MGHKWLGPYEVVKNLSKGFFTLQNMESGQIIQHILNCISHLLVPHHILHHIIH